MKTRVLAWIAGAAATLLAATAWGSPYTIDDFTTGYASMTVYDGYNSASTLETLLGDVIGGQRYSEIDYTGGYDDVTLNINRGGSQALYFSENAGSEGQIMLQYGYSTPLSANLSAKGNEFDLTFRESEDADPVQLTVWTGTSSSVLTVNTPQGLLYSQNQTVSVPASFADFTPSSGTGANFADIDKIEVQIVGSDAADFILDSITVDVPEPASAALLLLGGLAFLRRRRHK